MKNKLWYYVTGAEEEAHLLAFNVAVVILLIFSFMATVYYSGAVLNGLLQPSKSTINTIPQLIDSDFKLALWDIVFLKDFKVPHHKFHIEFPNKLTNYSFIELRGK